MSKLIKNEISSVKRTRKNDAITYALVTFLFVLFFVLDSAGAISRSTSGQLVPVCVYVVSAIALNLVVGFSGELSLGHAGFLSIGAFSGVVFYHLFGFISVTAIRLALCMIFAGITAGFLGFLIGLPVLRLSGDYLAIVTLAFGEIIKNLMNCVYLGYDASGWHFSFGTSLSMEGGTVILNGPMGVTGNQKASSFLAGFILVLFALTVVVNLIRSKTGRSIIAIRDNRIAAESLGLSASKYKMIAFVTSAALTGMAGALYVMNYASVAPAKFGFNTSVLILVFVVMGGLGNIRGGIIAAIILTILPEKLRMLGDYRMLIYAVLLIAMMLLTQSAKGKILAEKLTAPFKKLTASFKKDKPGKEDMA